MRKLSLNARNSLTTPSPGAIQAAGDCLRTAKASLRQAVRSVQSDLRNKRVKDLFNILSKDPSAAHRAIKAAKTNTASEIQNLKVSNKVYTGTKVPDGSPLYSSPHFQDTLMYFEMDQGSLQFLQHRFNELLHSLKADVNDFFSITASHFFNAGFEGLEHFHLLVNIIIV